MAGSRSAPSWSLFNPIKPNSSSMTNTFSLFVFVAYALSTKLNKFVFAEETCHVVLLLRMPFRPHSGDIPALGSRHGRINAVKRKQEVLLRPGAQFVVE